MISTIVGNLCWRRIISNSAWKKISRSVSLVSTDKIQINLNDNTGVCDIVLKNKPVNVLDRDVLSNILSTLQEAEDSSHIKAFVFSSIFPKVFSAGLDINECLQVPNDIRAFKDYWNLMTDVFIGLYSAKTVSVAAIDGFSPGGGCFLALACDYRIMTNGSHKIGLNETAVGLDVPFWACEMFKAQCGIGVGMRYLPYGCFYDVHTAEKICLIDQTCESKDLRAEVDKFLTNALSISVEARYTTKMYLRHEIIKRMKDGRDVDTEHKAGLFQRPEMQETLKQYISNLKKK